MASIDFKGKDGTIDAYKASAIPVWAVFNRKNIMQAGDGEQLLCEYLDLMEQHSSNTVYTLRLYRNVDADSITDKTEYNSSFSFQLSDSRAAYMGYGSMSGGAGSNNISARLAAIEKKLNEDGPEKEPTIGSTVLGWFQEPNDVVKIIGAVQMLLGKSSPAETMQVLGAIGSVDPQRNNEIQEMENFQLSTEQENTLLRYVKNIERLEKIDPNFPKNLEKLADLAEKNISMYNMALNFLK